jgi:hypothetical protein
MADYAEVNGVRMWYDERGAGDPLLTFGPVSTFMPIRRAGEGPPPA